MKYVVTYIHTVEITYNAIVEADSREEAIAKIEEDLDFISEEELDYQGLEVKVTGVEEHE